MKVFLTGATGFIGARFANKLAAEGHDVMAIGQIRSLPEKERSDALRKHGIHVMQIPLSDQGALAETARGCQVAYHLAAAQHEANVPDQYFWDVNVEGTRNVLKACLAARVEHVVHGSTIGVYGSALDGEISEETATRPDNIYGITKLEGEKVALGYKDELVVTSVRISETYGPGDRRLLKLFRAIKNGRFFLIGSGENIHQLIYVDDLISGLELAAQSDISNGQIITLAGPELLTTRQMCDGIADVLKRKISRWHAPMLPFLVIAVLMEKTLSPIGIQPPLHRRRLDFFRKSYYFSQEKSRKLLGFTPTTGLERGLAETVKWYVARGYL